MQSSGLTEPLRAGSVEDLQPGQALVVAGSDPPIAVFNVAGTYYATEATCTHAKSSLAEEGYFEGDDLECAYHLAKFSVRDGRALTPPARRSLCTYP
jgi:nitrite reductase/ring-hydroxylating ferredoxin subunit